MSSGHTPSPADEHAQVGADVSPAEQGISNEDIARARAHVQAAQEEFRHRQLLPGEPHSKPAESRADEGTFQRIQQGLLGAAHAFGHGHTAGPEPHSKQQQGQ